MTQFIRSAAIFLCAAISFITGCRIVVGADTASFHGRYGNSVVDTFCRQRGPRYPEDRRRFEECTTQVRDLITGYETYSYCDRYDLVVRSGIYVCPRARFFVAHSDDRPEDFKAKLTLSEEKLPKKYGVDTRGAGSTTVESRDDGKVSIEIEGGDVDELKFEKDRLIIDDPNVDVKISGSDEILSHVATP